MLLAEDLATDESAEGGEGEEGDGEGEERGGETAGESLFLVDRGNGRVEGRNGRKRGWARCVERGRSEVRRFCRERDVWFWYVQRK